jgi:glycosyltransferase involved in cell wall biosynthesis
MSISVCIATYNGELYIKEQLDSILYQLGAHDEIIISDDNSTDRTVAIIEALNEPRITLLKNNTFRSHVRNFENALKHAKGDYLFLADQDDIWLPDKIEKMLAQLTKYDLVVSDARMVDANKNILEDSFFSFMDSRKGFFKNLYKNTYLGCCMAFNRSILEISLPFPKDINMHDWWIGMISEIYGSVYFYNEKLILYRRHEETITSLSNKSTNSFLKKISFRLYMIKGLLLRIFQRKSEKI